MTGLVAWFLASRGGRMCAAALAIVVVIGGVVLRLLAMGRAQERGAQAHKNEVAAQDRKDLENEIDALGPADLDRRASRWLSDKRQW